MPEDSISENPIPENSNEQFDVLRSELLEAGVAPRHVRRIVAELDDHAEDLRSEAYAQGMSGSDATGFALQRIGDQQQIAARILESSDLRCWIYRYPRVARFYLPIAYALLLPATPVFAGFANPGIVLRWGAALMLSAGVTAGIMLALQLAIAIT
ncbi:MAG: hypothetical protein ACR2QR_08195 [Woeseiaceae bacterium]